jgi:general stress protein CsbA
VNKVSSPLISLLALIFVFLLMVILAGIRWNLNVALIYITLLVGDIEHFS